MQSPIAIIMGCLSLQSLLENIMGEIAALLTAVCWTLSSVFFTIAGQGVGSVIVNRTRLLVATVLLLLTHLALTGRVLPLDAGPERWFWMALSGIVGLVLGDAFLLQAYVLIGARIAMLIMAIVPVISALMAWLFLGETLSLIQIGGIGVTVAGIALVVLEQGNGTKLPQDRRRFVLGILCGLGGALGQALGLILSKKGLEGGYTVLSGVVMRAVAATLVMWLITFLTRQAGNTLRQLRTHPQALKAVTAGAVVGPFIGVWLSLVAVQATYVGIASTLMALTPILLLPFASLVFKEQVSPRAILGTVTSLTGVALIFLAP